MKIIIDIDEKDYNNIEPFLNGETIKGGINLFKTLEIIKNGTPLPKGHGDLKDTIKLKAKMFDLPQQPEGNYWDGVDAVGELIDNAPIIIEADKEN